LKASKIDFFRGGENKYDEDNFVFFFDILDPNKLNCFFFKQSDCYYD